MKDIAAGALLALDVLLLALVACLLVRAAARGARRFRRRRRRPSYAVRRCESCRMLWQGEPGVDYSRTEVLLRRAERRRARGAARPVKGWAKARGWSRCPSCLSTRVRTSGDNSRVDEVNTKLSFEAVGYLATAVGVALLAIAALGLAARG